MEPVIRRHEACAAVFADLHAFAFRTQNHPLRIFRVDQNCVDDPIARRSALPLSTFIGRLPQTARSAGIERIEMLRILLNQLRAPKNKRNAAITLPVLSRVNAVVNAGTSRGVHVRRIRWIDDDAHHV